MPLAMEAREVDNGDGHGKGDDRGWRRRLMVTAIRVMEEHRWFWTVYGDESGTKCGDGATHQHETASGGLVGRRRQ